jgi:hypothetical protein
MLFQKILKALMKKNSLNASLYLDKKLDVETGINRLFQMEFQNLGFSHPIPSEKPSPPILDSGKAISNMDTVYNSGQTELNTRVY